MAITRTQIARQLLQFGGGADLGAGATGMGSGSSGFGAGRNGAVDTGDFGSQAMNEAATVAAERALGSGRDDISQALNEAERIRNRRFAVERPTLGMTLADLARGSLAGRALTGLQGLIDRSRLKRSARFPGEDEMAKDRIAELIDQQRDESDGSQIVLPIIPKQEPIITEDEVEEEKPIERSLAFRADGGRIGLQEGGGIEQRLEQLGGDVTSAEQVLQGINQRLKSAESSLGSGGGLGVFQSEGPVGRPLQLPNIQPGAAQDLATQVIQSPQQDPNIFGYDPSGSFNAQDAYAAAQKAAQESRKSGFAGQVILPGEMSFEDFSNMFERGGLQPLRAAGSDSLAFPNLQSLGKPIDFVPMRGGAEMFRNSGIPAASYADGGDVVGGEFDFESARQMYGLGKLVKKVTRTVKKIAKSPVGKAAIAAATIKFGGQGLAKIFPTTFGTTAKSPFLRAIGKGQFFGDTGIFSAGKDLLFGPSAVGPNVPTGLLDKIGGKAGLGIIGVSALAGLLTPEQENEAQALADNTGIDIEEARRSILRAGTRDDFRARAFRAEGGSIKEPVAKKTMPLLDLDGKEMDLRAEGGFVPIGRMEKADDVPARLSKNEFVFTADAVRNAGDGNVDKGAEVMYNMMKNLEAGGDVSEESQGLEGARRMFQTSKRLEEVL